MMASKVHGIQLPPLGRLRFADLDDVPIVMSMLTDNMKTNFRIETPSDISRLIENSVLSICQLDVNGVVVGFLSAKDYPLIPAVHPGAWEEFVWNKYKLVDLRSRNTLFLHMLCWLPYYGRDAVDGMLLAVFMHDFYLKHIAIMKSIVECSLLNPSQMRAESSFKRVVAMERGISGDRLPSLWVADRNDVNPRMKIRRAVEEDNDDLIPIIERHSKRLRELYGDFYISELLSRHPDSERVLLVCERKEQAVGVICLNRQINFEALEENFELSPFAGLRHIDQGHKRPQAYLDESGTNLQASQCTVVEAMHASATNLDASNSRKDFGEESTKGSPPGSGVLNLNQPYDVSHLDYLDLLDDEEEELDFEIVNIDPELLWLPQTVPADNASKGAAANFMHISEGKQKDSANDTKEKARKPPTTPLSAQAKQPEPLRYSGTPNAFLLELFAIRPDYDERCGFELLEAAFEALPGRDYCVLSLPSARAAFPLLEHFTAVTPYGARSRLVNEALYVAHVNSVKGEAGARAAEPKDAAALRPLLQHAPRRDALKALFLKALPSPSLRALVLQSRGQPVGLVVCGPLEDGAALRAQFELAPEPPRPGADGAVLAAVLSPALEPHSRWFLREALRLSGFAQLFWTSRLHAKGDASPGRNLTSLAGWMRPVRPLSCSPPERGAEVALWGVQRPLLALPRVDVNRCVVVVGASRCGLAFLEALLLGPSSAYLSFARLCLVSEGGLPLSPEALLAARTCVPAEGRYSGRLLRRLPFAFYLDVVTAVMVGIDRKKKCITLKGGGVKYYDDLVITCGRQFQHPDYLKEPRELAEEAERGAPCRRAPMDDPRRLPEEVPPPPPLPDNVLLTNSLHQANHNLVKLLRLRAERGAEGEGEGGRVAVFGDCVEAYCCVAALLQLGLSAQALLLLEPFPPDDAKALRVNCFNDETVDSRVQDSLRSLGVRVLRRCRLLGWGLEGGGCGGSGGRVAWLSLLTERPDRQLRLPVLALFYYGRRAVDCDAFRAINESGLVYDGGLVVGPRFETNDAGVFGAGSCTTHSRRLRARDRDHRFFSSEDAGEALAREFLRRLDPFLAPGPSAASRGYGSSLLEWQPVSEFRSAVSLRATLPGPLYYLSSRRPGPELPELVQRYLPRQGHELATDAGGNWVRLRLDALHRVQSLRCLAREPFDGARLQRLHGLHAAFLRELLARHRMGKVPDLFRFFDEPWMAALYREPFADLVLSMDGLRLGTETETGTLLSVVEKLAGRESEARAGAPAQCGARSPLRASAASAWAALGGERALLRPLLRHLQRHRAAQPLYALPPSPLDSA